MNSMSGEKLKGAPYTGTLPAVLTGTKAGYLHRYKIYGNLSQNGTPTPSDPIVPSECGERTGNLFDYQTMAVSVAGYYLNATGQEVALSDWRISDYIPCDGTEFTLNKIGGNTPAICLYDANKQFLAGKSYQTGGTVIKMPITISSATNAKYIRFSYVTSGDDLSEITITEGSTAPTSYIPYGYKLPLLSGSTPVDIYLGAEPLRKIGDYADYIDYGTGKVVRQVKKLLLDGTESFTILREGVYRTTINGYLRELDLHIAVCSHFGGGMTIYSASSTINNTVSFLVSDSGNNYVYFTSSNYQTVSAFKTFIQQQYSNGTPVTLWYLLATPTEEDPPVPFPQIPTTANSTTISWGGSGLAPSQFDSIQEWVDIPTYKRVNGAWVEDN